MTQTNHSRPGMAGLLMGLAVLFCPAAGADTVYKCVAGGKTNFTSNPKDAGGDCQPMELHVPEPNPVDVSRGMERIREYDEEKKAEAERRRKAKELNPEAQQRARNAELEKSLARQPVPSLWGTGRGRRKGGYR